MVARELNVLVRDANYLLVLLPIVNFTFIYSNMPTRMILGAIIVSSVLCTTVLNFTIGVPDPEDQSASDSLPNGAGALYIVSILLWICSWAYSVYRICDFIGESSTYANILFTISVGWTMFLISHYILDWWIDDYSNPIFEFKN